MKRSILVRLDLPGDWKSLKFPKALDRRLHELLTKQNAEGKLTATERREVVALAGLVDMLSLLKARAAQAGKQ